MQAKINRHRMRAAARSLVAIAVAAVTFAGCKRGEAGDAKAESAPAPTTVGTENVVVVSQAELASGPAISGNLQAAQEATVRAQIGGTVLQTLVDEGSSRQHRHTARAHRRSHDSRPVPLGALGGDVRAERCGGCTAEPRAQRAPRRRPAPSPIATSRPRDRRTLPRSPSSPTPRRA